MHSLTPSHIIEYLFCPRFTYFEYVLCIPQYEEKNYKVMKGRELHDQKLEQNKEYLRRRIGVQQKYLDQYLTNSFLRGRVDEVLLLSDHTYAPLDYKFAKYDDLIYLTYKIQLHCYAVLIEDNFRGKVNRGFLVYVRSKHKLIELEITDHDKNIVRNSSNTIVDIIENNLFPKATKYKNRCVGCTYSNICIK